MRQHGTKTMPKFLPADGEASWSLFPISASLLHNVQPPFCKGLGVNLQPNFQKVCVCGGEEEGVDRTSTFGGVAGNEVGDF